MRGREKKLWRILRMRLRRRCTRMKMRASHRTRGANPPTDIRRARSEGTPTRGWRLGGGRLRTGAAQATITEEATHPGVVVTRTGTDMTRDRTAQLTGQGRTAVPPHAPTRGESPLRGAWDPRLGLAPQAGGVRPLPRVDHIRATGGAVVMPLKKNLRAMRTPVVVDLPHTESNNAVEARNGTRVGGAGGTIRPINRVRIPTPPHDSVQGGMSQRVARDPRPEQTRQPVGERPPPSAERDGIARAIVVSPL